MAKPKPGSIESLNALAERREGLLAELERTSAALHAAIIAAHGAGVPKLTIAREARIARQTVYNVLGKG
jgi:DNA invertase Pin-like site-specific DNA recombinase